MYIRLIGYYLRQQFKVELAYRTNLLLGLLGQVLFTGLSLAFIGAFLPAGANINGWSFWQILFLIGLGDVAFGLNGIFVFRTFLSLNSSYILGGRLDQLLTQPAPALYSLILHNLNVVDLIVVIKGIVLLGIATLRLDMAWTWALAGRLALMSLAGATVYAGILLTMASTGFWMKRKDSAVGALLSLNQLCQYPLSLYPMGMQFFLSFVMPVAFAAYYPAQWLLGQGGQGGLAMPLAAILGVAAVCAALALAVFQAGLRKYSSAGS